MYLICATVSGRFIRKDRRGHDRVVVSGFTTKCAISAYHH